MKETVYIQGVAYKTVDGKPHFGEAQSKVEFEKQRDENARKLVLATGSFTPLDEHPDNQVPQSVIDAALAEREKLPEVAVPKLQKELSNTYLTLPVEVRVRNKGLYVEVTQHLSDGDVEAAAVALSQANIADEDKKYMDTFLKPVKGLLS